MKWRKLGRIFEPKGQYDWMQSHGTMPLAYHIGGDIYRIYFGTRDEKNRTQMGYIEISLNNLHKIIKISQRPVLELGKPGLFDDSGVFASSIVDFKGQLYLYYNGWNRGYYAPYYSSIGLAISRDKGLSFKKYSEAPILGRNKEDPFSLMSPWVIYSDGIWMMWYTSVTDFKMLNNKPMYYYVIKYAESEDGINWKITGKIAIKHKYKNETRIARPCVLFDDGIYKMWYCYAVGHGGYRIGYAESEDGIVWDRKDDIVGINVSLEGWDSEMIAYPFVFKHRNTKYMLYSGNSYGKTGFGLAVLEEE